MSCDDPEARLAALREALLTGLVVRGRLAETVAEVLDAGLLHEDHFIRLTKAERRATDSLALTFANLAGIVQDQIIRLVLLLEEYDLEGVTRRGQRQRAEAIGLIKAERRLDRVAEARNRVAHQYPRDPVRQQALIRASVEQSAAAILAFDDALSYATRAYFDGPLES